MRLIPSYRQLTLILTPIFFVLGAIIALALPKLYLDINYINWLLLAAAVLLIITPFGNRSITIDKTTHTRLRPPIVFIKIFMLEMLLLFIYLGINLVINRTLPIYHQPQAHFWQHNIHWLTLQLGLFPWPAFALAAVGFGYFAFNRQEQTFLSNFSNALFKTPHQSKIASVINALMRQCQNVAVSIMIAVVILMLLSLLPTSLLNTLNPAAYSVQMALMLILLFTLTNPFRQRLWTMCQRSRSISLVVAIVVVLTVLSFLIFEHGFSLVVTATNPHPIGIISSHMNWQITWKVFNCCWWLSLMPLVGVAFARWLPGYSLRSALLMILLPAAGMQLVICFLPAFSISNMIAIKLLIALAAIAVFIWLQCHSNRAMLPAFVMSYMPASGQTKYRDYRLALLRILRVAITGVFLFLPIGFKGLGLLTILFSYMAIVFAVLLCVGLITAIISA